MASGFPLKGGQSGGNTCLSPPSSPVRLPLHLGWCPFQGRCRFALLSDSFRVYSGSPGSERLPTTLSNPLSHRLAPLGLQQALSSTLKINKLSLCPDPLLAAATDRPLFCLFSASLPHLVPHPGPRGGCSFLATSCLLARQIQWFCFPLIEPPSGLRGHGRPWPFHSFLLCATVPLPSPERGPPT